MGHTIIITDGEFISRDSEAMLELLVGRNEFLRGEVMLHVIQYSYLLG